MNVPQSRIQVGFLFLAILFISSPLVESQARQKANKQGCTENHQSCLQGCGSPGQQPDCERGCRVLYNKCMGLNPETPRSAPKAAPGGSKAE